MFAASLHMMFTWTQIDFGYHYEFEFILWEHSRIAHIHYHDKII